MYLQNQTLEVLEGFSATTGLEGRAAAVAVPHPHTHTHTKVQVQYLLHLLANEHGCGSIKT
jgi:hypothetical protein